MQHVKMYTGTFCPYCNMAKQLLKQMGVDEVEEINVSRSSADFNEMQQLTGLRSVPQIFIGETHVGGFTDLYALHQKGDLLPLLQAE